MIYLLLCLFSLQSGINDSFATLEVSPYYLPSYKNDSFNGECQTPPLPHHPAPMSIDKLLNSSVSLTPWKKTLQAPTLCLMNRGLTGIRPYFKNFTCLTYLDLSGNKIEEIGKFLKSLPLKILDITNNRLKTVNAQDLPQTLVCLFLRNNEIHSVLNIDHLTQLKSLYLDSNCLQKLPTPIKHLPLELLSIKNNQLCSLSIEDLPQTLNTAFFNDNHIKFLVGAFFDHLPCAENISLAHNHNPLEILSSKDYPLIQKGILKI